MEKVKLEGKLKQRTSDTLFTAAVPITVKFCLLMFVHTFTLMWSLPSHASLPQNLCKNYFTSLDLLEQFSSEELHMLWSAVVSFAQVQGKVDQNSVDIKNQIESNLQSFLRFKSFDSTHKKQFRSLFVEWLEQYQSRPANKETQNQEMQVALDRKNTLQFQSTLYKILNKYETDNINIAFVKSCGRNNLNQQKVDLQEVQFLLKAGANIDFYMDKGHTALFNAIRNKNKPLVLFLLESGAKQVFLDKFGRDFLTQAVQQKDIELVKLLLAAGGASFSNGGDHLMPLHEACRENQREIVELLLHAGVPVDVQDWYGFTALMLASDRGNFGIVKILLEAHADPRLKDNEGKTALRYAQWRNIVSGEPDTTYIIEILKKYTRDINNKTWTGYLLGKIWPW